MMVGAVEKDEPVVLAGFVKLHGIINHGAHEELVVHESCGGIQLGGADELLNSVQLLVGIRKAAYKADNFPLVIDGHFVADDVVYNSVYYALARDVKYNFP